MGNIPSIWVIILNYNARELTCQCLKSLSGSDYPRLKILLVDNASTDDTIAVVQTDFPQVTVLKNKKNYYFAKGNNTGIQYALDNGADFIFILNNDTEIDGQCIGRLLSFLRNHPGCAACQPLLLQMQKPDQVASAGCRVALSGRAADLFYGLAADKITPHPFPVCGVTGGAFLIRAQAFKKVGLFCEYFKMYFEDVDLSLRLLESGYSLYCVPAATIRHYVSASTREKGIFFHTYYTERNSYLVVLRNYPFLQIIRSYALKIPAAAAGFAVNVIKGNFAYSTAILLSIGYGLIALFFYSFIRAWELAQGKKKKFPFWPFIEKNTLYP